MPYNVLTFRNTLNSNPEFTKMVLNKMSDKYTNKYDDNTDLWGNFKNIRDKYYPITEEDRKNDEKWVSIYAASLNILSGKMSKFQITRLKDKEILRARSKTETLLYKPDVELLRDMLAAVDDLIKLGVIQDTKDFQGKRVFAIIPVEARNKGSSEEETKNRALTTLMESDFMQKWIKTNLLLS